MFFLKRRPASLEMYDAKPGERKHTVFGNNVAYLSQKYPPEDFRYKFVTRYMEYMEAEYGIKIYNCRFEHPAPTHNPYFLNLYIFIFDEEMWNFELIKNADSPFIKGFCSVLKKCRLPAVTPKTDIQFFRENIKFNLVEYIWDAVWHDIHKKIGEVFPEVADLSAFSERLFVFIHEEFYAKAIQDAAYLQKLKAYFYQLGKKHDTYNVLHFDELRIKVDNYAHYAPIGGYYYFHSDYPTDAMLL